MMPARRAVKIPGEPAAPLSLARRCDHLLPVRHGSMSECPSMQPSQVTYPSEWGIPRPLPWFSICGLLSVPLLVSASLPLLRAHVARELASDYFTKIHDLGALALATEIVFSGTLAALLGLLLSSFSRRRRERWKYLRMASWVINGIVAAAGILWISLLLIGNLLQSSRGSL